ncbi:putative P-loop containing nucleoside triphosphate hydrolase, leucine-rich repeat domain superfamily [Helianthus annuus]|uniref:P-loop containing nucleoside triphosphate hydrolase, leucine-rich repeat domain superfamily n=1 Tax=Helianthus annuus TaxID=4232 RepID=A0A9K3H1Y8_HELAN|nr:putative P-loop containing nucleoside triphosphate hydrolase, leucine-rich repeat domain superfamily [Helianthus annuus]KAJ0455430.1 putative P-loop containing nucleoside triphosphate hydrolase, leucine-rich repeat domain superfamily [Helianthus annuus]KAJ0472911.1 putative P-loop containing nucleoside triphosphate hydrolase, leucine-rich repeat domain superfamily [Helianthus annuus]KAJ0652345.1 putative P-loop containing nucleoside triphosphate hydrolase, leucine-rich repeat domain superfami
MDFVSPIIGPIVESLLVPVKKHLGFLVSSTKYVKKVDARMKQLNVIAQEVQDERDKAVENIEIVPARVESWLEEVKILNQRSNLIEAIGCFNVTKRYKVGKQSYSILEEIKDLEDRESKIEFTHAQRPLAEVGSTSTSTMGTQDNFESRDLIFNNALKALQSNEESHRMIALCGMGGVGKTTMMEQLKKAVEDLKMFDLVVKVVIGENTDPTSLQKAIAEYIGNTLVETTKGARAERLRKIFEVKSEQRQKKILVIMDDIWKEVELTDFGLSPLPNGLKLLFTSRFENVCTHMGVGIGSIFRVGVLSGIEAKTLFFRICHLDGDQDELQRIGEDIVKKCGGLPIAIVTIAKSLRGNKKEAWKEALSNLQHHDLQDHDNIVHKVFEMSYKNLKREDDKAIFLLSGLFPDDFNIPVEDLMMYGWGLNLFANVHTLIDARIRAKVCVENLIHANLLTESDVNGCVKMHDLVRAFVLSNFSKVKQASIVNHDSMASKRLISDSCERILLKCTGMSGFPVDFNSTNLSLMILMDGYEFFKLPEDMYKRMKNLEVMSYVNMGIPRLPITFGHTTTLRTLSLRSCSLTDDISFLGSLCNLETLSLVDCNIRRLPSAIGELKKLKLLDLTGCVDLYIDQGVLQNLDSLKELYMRASKGRPVRFAKANCDELEKLSQVLFALELEFYDNELQPKCMSFKNLGRFRISIGCELNYGEKYSFRNTLNLVAECTELNESNIGDLFKHTEELRLQVKYMIRLKDISLHHTFPQLKILHISKCAELTYLFTVDMANGLKQLERLRISDCPCLEALIGENNGVGLVTLKKLNYMFLEDLPEMVSLCNNVVELPEMVELKLAGLPNFMSIYPDDSEMQPLFKKEGVIPKLEKLDISKMENLKQVWPCQISTSEKADVSKLRQIRVRGCDRLINLFPRNPLPLLNHLEEVVVKKCGSVEVLFNIDFESVCGMGKNSSCRLRKIEAKELRKLKELWRMEGVNESHTLVNHFKGVQSIHIEECGNFTDIYTPTSANFDLGALTSYHYHSVYNSGALEERERRNEMTESDQEVRQRSFFI